MRIKQCAIYNFYQMDLEILRDYLSFLARAELQLQDNRRQFEEYPAFAFYKLIAPKAQSALDANLIGAFVKSFTYNFQASQPHQLMSSPNFALFPQEERPNQLQLMAKGIQLFLERWGREGKVDFQEFCLFAKDEGELPGKNEEIAFPLKKKFYQMVEDQIQSLLDGETFRKAVGLHYKNMTDLFEVLSSDGEIGVHQLKNLFLMVGERKPEDFFKMIGRRFSLPMDETTFRRWFNVTASKGKYQQQTKIFYSSIKKKKFEFKHEEDERFTTPRGKTAKQAGVSSTKLTKADRLHSLKRSAIEVSRFMGEECPEVPERDDSILASILAQEEKLNEMKRQLLYQGDYDLELIYERRGQDFEEILNRKYGSCNFTSFVRYIVPQDYEHRYYAFIKYNKQSRLSPETDGLLEDLLADELRKEARIANWWKQTDRQVVFRSFCDPGHKNIHNANLANYFTERECKILLDRFDPNKTGEISYDFFQ